MENKLIMFSGIAGTMAVVVFVMLGFFILNYECDYKAEYLKIKSQFGVDLNDLPQDQVDMYWKEVKLVRQDLKKEYDSLFPDLSKEQQQELDKRLAPINTQLEKLVFSKDGVALSDEIKEKVETLDGKKYEIQLEYGYPLDEKVKEFYEKESLAYKGLREKHGFDRIGYTEEEWMAMTAQLASLCDNNSHDLS